MSQNLQSQRGNSGGVMLIVILFIAIVAAGTWAAYTYGEGHVMIDGRTISELEPWEVVGGVILGILGLFIGLTMGILGLLIGLIAAVVSIVLALAGVFVGLFITAGTLLGPFLLLAAIILLMRRKKDDDEAPAAITGGRETSASASMWVS